MVTPRDVHDSLEFDNLLNDSNVLINLHEVILVFGKEHWKLDRFKELKKNLYRFVTPIKTDKKYYVLSTKVDDGISNEIIIQGNKILSDDLKVYR